MAAQWIRLTDVPGFGDAGFYGWLYADPVDAAVFATHDLGLPMFTEPGAPRGADLGCRARRVDYDDWMQFCGGMSGLGATYPLPFPLPNLTSEDIDPIGREAANAAWQELQPKLQKEIDGLVRRAHAEAPSLAKESFKSIQPDLDHRLNLLLGALAVLGGTMVGGLVYLALRRS